MAVLTEIIRNVHYVQRLVGHTETELNEEFLRDSWRAHSHVLGALPTGPMAIAELRLAVQVQGSEAALRIAHACRVLEPADRDVLAKEMALSGVVGQTYASSEHRGGPAFLIYYGPAAVRGLAQEDAVFALRVLAKIHEYRRERAAINQIVNDTFPILLQLLRSPARACQTWAR